MPRAIKRSVERSVSDSLIQFERMMQRRLRAGGEIGLNVKNGALSRSLHRVVSTTPTGVQGIVTIGGTQAPYAVAQEYGGTLRPRTSQWLAIPVSSGLTRAGRRRFASLRQLANVFFVKKADKLLAFQSSASKRKNAKAKLVAVLQRSVTLRPRLKFFQTWRAMLPAFKDNVSRAIKKAIQAKGGQA